MKEPTAIYSKEGNHEIWGHKLGYEIVDAHELDNKIKEGWFKHPQEAIDAQNKLDTKSMPTRAELLQKAKELKITVDAKWNDKKLLEMINNAH